LSCPPQSLLTSSTCFSFLTAIPAAHLLRSHASSIKTPAYRPVWLTSRLASVPLISRSNTSDTCLALQGPSVSRPQTTTNSSFLPLRRHHFSRLFRPAPRRPSTRKPRAILVKHTPGELLPKQFLSLSKLLDGSLPISGHNICTAAPSSYLLVRSPLVIR
jgi:hypothetical protein